MSSAHSDVLNHASAWGSHDSASAATQEEVPLGVPDVLICSVGTEIFFEKPGSDGTEPQPDKKWTQLLDQGWNRQAALKAAAELSELKPQVGASMTLCKTAPSHSLVNAQVFSRFGSFICSQGSIVSDA